jgi:hypothetical protein
MHNMGITGCGRWIPVTERLPPHDETVLYTCDLGPNEGFTDVESGRWEGARNDTGLPAMRPVWGDVDDWGPCSHWMPLPAPPTAAAASNDPVRDTEASDGPGDGWRWVKATGPDGPGEVHGKEDECRDCLGIWRQVRHVIGRVCDEPCTYRRRITPAAIIAAQEAEIRRLRLTDEEREAILLAVEHGENASSLGSLRPIWTLTLRRLLKRTK